MPATPDLPLETLENAIQVAIDALGSSVIESFVVAELDLEMVTERPDIPNPPFALIQAIRTAEPEGRPHSTYLGIVDVTVRIVINRQKNIESTLHGTAGLRKKTEDVMGAVVSSFVGLTQSVQLLTPLQWQGTDPPAIFEDWIYNDLLLQTTYAEDGFINNN